MKKGRTPVSHERAYVCIHVFQGSAPALLVSRPEGDWCFLCGEMHPDDESSYRVVGIGHVLERDPSLDALADLPADWEAERKALGGKWKRLRMTPESH
jgi:hypothetical protein